MPTWIFSGSPKRKNKITHKKFANIFRIELSTVLQPPPESERIVVLHFCCFLQLITCIEYFLVKQLPSSSSSLPLVLLLMFNSSNHCHWEDEEDEEEEKRKTHKIALSSPHHFERVCLLKWAISVHIKLHHQQYFAVPLQLQLVYYGCAHVQCWNRKRKCNEEWSWKIQKINTKN